MGGASKHWRQSERLGRSWWQDALLAAHIFPPHHLTASTGGAGDREDFKPPLPENASIFVFSCSREPRTLPTNSQQGPRDQRQKNSRPCLTEMAGFVYGRAMSRGTHDLRFIVAWALCSCSSLPSAAVHLENNTSTSFLGSWQPRPWAEIQRSFTFWAGGLAGVVSAAVTHQLPGFPLLDILQPA